MQQDGALRIEFLDSNEKKVCRLLALASKETQPISKHNWFDGEIQFVNEIALQKIRVGLRASQERDGSVWLEDCFDRHIARIAKYQIAALPFRALDSASKNNAISS